MASSPWVVSLTAVAATGNITQLYPDWCTAGSGATTQGTLVRRPCEGSFKTMQINTDGINGGTIEIWDANGEDSGIDVNTASTITNAQMATLIAAGNAKLLYSQDFTGSAGARLAIASGQFFAKGLAVRFSNATATGTCVINMAVSGGCRKTEICGA